MTEQSSLATFMKKISGTKPEVTTAPQPLSCHQIKPHIRDLHEIWGRLGVI
jgi:hypothetical protein